MAALIATCALMQRFWPAPSGVLMKGAIVGGLTSLIAFGIALTYRSNRVINFAQGDLGGIPAALGALLVLQAGWPYLLAIPVVLATAIALGALVEFVFIRRFFTAPRLILTVVTIGLSQILAGVTTALPQLLGSDSPQNVIPPPIDLEVSITGVVFNANEMIAVIVVPLVIVALSAFLKFTDIGIAIRASAQSADRAALLGVPVKRVQTVIWVITTLLAAVAIFLRAGILGLPIGSVLGPTVLVRALAACVIGRMERMSLIVASSVGLGVLESAIVFSTGRSQLVDPILFVVIVGALLVQSSSSGRREDAEASSWQAARTIRPVPRQLRQLPEVVWSKRTLDVVGVLGLFSLPLVATEGQLNLVGIVILFAIVGMSLVVLTGWAGQVSLGQIAFFAIGSGVSGYLSVDRGWDLSLACLGGAITGALIAVLIGLPALRITGLFLAVVTMSFALTTSRYLLNPEFLTWLPTGAVPRTPLFGRISVESETSYYLLCATVLVLVVGAVRGLRASRTGRLLIGVRENPRGAQAYGVNVMAAKLTAFAVAGFLAALAGALFVHHQQRLGISAYGVDESREAFIQVVIGGLGSVPGAILGSMLIQGITYFTTSFPSSIRPLLGFLTSGVGLIVVLLALPGGFSDLYYRVRDHFLRLIADRRGIVVPSLLADRREDSDTTGAVERNTPPDLVGPAIPAGDTDETVVLTTPLLSVRSLDVAYGNVQVLFGVDFEVAEGDSIALLGTNGAGKSTLLRAICGLQTARRGTVTFDGQDITAATPQEITSRGVVQVPGGKGVFPELSVAENLQIAGWLRRKDPTAVEERIEEVLGYFPVLRERWDQPAGNLSGGEQQMLTLGQAFILEPRLLMIDELSLGLAPTVVAQLLEIVDAIRKLGTTIIVVEQSINVALTIADTAYFLEKGEVRFKGRTTDLLARPEILRSVFLEGAGALLPDGGAPPAPVSVGTTLHPAPDVRAAPDATAEVALRATGLTKAYGGIRAVNGVSFDLRVGEVLGFIGPNGAGKTTLFDLLSGYVPPDEGTLELYGTDITSFGPDRRAWAGLGRSFQDARLFPGLTVSETVQLALERVVDVKDPLAAALRLPAWFESEASVTARADELVESFQLGAYADKFISDLSTGTRRMVDLACIAAHGPKVILFDEPSSGIAQRETEALGPVLLQLRALTDASIIVIEHDMPLISSIADRMIALDLGTVVTVGTPSEVLRHPHVVSAYLGDNDATIARSGPGTNAVGNGHVPVQHTSRRRRVPLHAERAI